MSNLDLVFAVELEPGRYAHRGGFDAMAVFWDYGAADEEARWWRSEPTRYPKARVVTFRLVPVEDMK